MTAINQRHVRELQEIAEVYGFRFKGQTNGGHLRWRDTHGNTVITAGTPSDHRAWLNAQTQMRRYWRQTQEH